MLRIFFVLSFLLLPLPLKAQWLERSEAIMGTEVKVRLWHEDKVRGERLISAVMAEMHRINARMSPWVDDSELAEINRLAYQQPVTLSAELFQLLQQAQQMSRQSDGAFDITFASVGFAYDYREKVKPSAQAQKKLAEKVDYRQLKLNPETRQVRFLKPGMKIDLGGIAKGHGVDNAVQLLRQGGVKHALVSAGGDSRLLGDHRGRPWYIGIREPRGEGFKITLPLADLAVSTSGDYERYFMDGDQRVHHILNPRSGAPVTGTRSVTIIAPSSRWADALSTSVFVLGPEQGMALVESLAEVSAVIIDGEGRVHVSSDLQ